MNDEPSQAGELRSTPKGPIRFKEGGWLLLLTLLVALALLAWGLAPALLQLVDRPPGNGKDIESYAFDLSNPRTSLESIEPSMLHRDMVPVEMEPIILSPDEMVEANEGRRKYLVSDDLVIGVVIDGQARAYPLQILNVHEVINDRMGDVPLAVTWHWPSGATQVLDRRVDGNEMKLGVSGLVSGGNQLLYPIRTDTQRGEEPLVSQALGQSITGSELEFQLVPHEVVPWSDWSERHPNTTVIAARPELKNRYKKGKPDTWFASDWLMFKTPVPEIGPSPKTHMLWIRGNGVNTFVSMDDLIETAGSTGKASVDHAETTLELAVTADPAAARLIDPPDGIQAMRILWISGHALAPLAGPPAPAQPSSSQMD